MVGRPPKTLAEHVRDGSFRSRRHFPLLASPDLPWPWFALMQARFRAATSDADRRAIAVEFQRAVVLVQEQTLREQADGGGRSLGEDLAALGKPGSAARLLRFFPHCFVHPKGPLIGKFRLEPWQQRFLREFY